MKQQITYKELKQTFVIFLKENKALKEYKINSYRYRQNKDWEKYISPIKFLYDNDDFKYGLIERAFIWASTPQGHKYWQKLNDKWYEKIIIMKKK